MEGMQKDVPKGQNVLNHDLTLKDTHSPTVTSSGVCMCVCENSAIFGMDSPSLNALKTVICI